MSAARLGLVLLGALLALPAGAATICVNVAGTGGCQAGIQAGVNAAVAGDTLKIQAGVYSVGASVNKPNLQIVGANKATTIIDAEVLGYGFVVSGVSGVQIKNLTIRNGTGLYSIGIDGDGTLVQGVRIVGAHGVPGLNFAGSGIAVNLGHTGVQIIGNEIRACRNGVFFLDGVTSSVIKGNTIVGADAGGIVIGPTSAANANNQVVSNRISNTPVPISFSGDAAFVSGNLIENAIAPGAVVSGVNPVVQSNKITAAGFLDVNCVGCTGGGVKGNTVVGSTMGFGLRAQSDAAGLVVQANKVNLTLGFGLEISGNTIQSIQNSVADTAGFGLSASCFISEGPANTFTKDTALRCGGHGFYLSGDTDSVTQSTATGAGATGFVIDGAGGFINNTLTGNKAISTVGQGFAVVGGATGQTLTGNSAKNDRLDYCGPVVAAGQFATQSTTCDILQ